MRKLSVGLLGASLAMTMMSPALAEDTDVTIVLSEELDLIDPCMASQSNIGRVVLQNISETMTELDGSGGGLMPRLAESWETVDEDTWRFSLRKGVVFSDGTSFGAEDVAHSLKRVVAEGLVCEIGAKYFGGSTITTEIIDDHTIEITSDPAQPIMPLQLSGLTIVPSETPMEYTREPIGTGPYVLSEWNVGQNVILTRRDDYWGETPAVTKATYVFRSDDSVRAAMVATGEADFAPKISELDATNPATDFAYPNSETVYLRLDTLTAPLDDVRVRQAMNLAIDREAFIGTIIPAEAILATAIVPPSTIGWNADLKVPAYDVEKARALLAEAKADGVPVDAEITLIGRTSNFANVTEVMEALLAMYQDAGFNMKLEMYEVAEWLDFYSQPFAEDRGPQVIEAMHDNAKGDPVFSMYFKYASEGLQSALRDPAVDKMIADATAATGDDRTSKWSDLFAYLHDEITADVQLFHMVGFSRVSERLDFTPTIATNSEIQLSQIGFK